jgi:hypothetical protein
MAAAPAAMGGAPPATPAMGPAMAEVRPAAPPAKEPARHGAGRCCDSSRQGPATALGGRDLSEGARRRTEPLRGGEGSGGCGRRALRPNPRHGHSCVWEPPKRTAMFPFFLKKKVDCRRDRTVAGGCGRAGAGCGLRRDAAPRRDGARRDEVAILDMVEQGEKREES